MSENSIQYCIKYCIIDSPKTPVDMYHKLTFWSDESYLTFLYLKDIFEKYEKIEISDDDIVKFSLNKEWVRFNEHDQISFHDIESQIVDRFLIISTEKTKEDKLVSKITESVKNSLLDIFHPEMMNPELLNNIQSSITSTKLTQELTNKSQVTEDDNHIDLLVLYSNPLVDKSKSIPKYYDKMVLDIDKEIDSILEGVSNYNIRTKLMVADKTLLEELNQPTIIHISCHGINTNLLTGECYLCFEDKGEMIEYKSIDLKNFLNLHDIDSNQNKKTKLAVIAACHSEYAGKVLLECGILNVVCINSLSQLLDDAAHIFARQFYKFIAAGHTINKAFEFAKRQITLKMPKEKLYPCCCSHQHKQKCIFKTKYNECDYHIKHCNCKEYQYHLHAKNCDFGKKLAERFKSVQNSKSEYINACCCMEEDIPHDESQKFILIHKDDNKDFGEINFNFKRNEKQKNIIIGSNWKTITEIYINYFPNLKGRCELVFRIFDRIANAYKNSFKIKQRLITVYGQYGCGKGLVSSLVARFAWERGYLNNGITSIKRDSYHNKSELEELIQQKIFLSSNYSTLDLRKNTSNPNSENELMIKEDFLFIIEFDHKSIDKNDFLKLVSTVIENTVTVWIIAISREPFNSEDYEVAYEVKDLPIEFSSYYFSMKLRKDKEKLLNSENLLFQEIQKICGGNIKKICKAIDMINEDKQMPEILSHLKDITKYSFVDDDENTRQFYNQHLKNSDYKRKFIFLLSLVPFGISENAFIDITNKLSDNVDYSFKKYLEEIKYITVYEPTQIGIIKQDKIIIPFRSKEKFFATVNELYTNKEEKEAVIELILKYYKSFLRKICFKLNKNPEIYEFSPFLNGGIWKTLNPKFNYNRKLKNITEDSDYIRIEPKDFLLVSKNLDFIFNNLGSALGDLYHLSSKMIKSIGDISITVPTIIDSLKQGLAKHELNSKIGFLNEFQKKIINIIYNLDSKIDLLFRIQLCDINTEIFEIEENFLNNGNENEVISEFMHLEKDLIKFYHWKLHNIDNIEEKPDFKININECLEKANELRTLINNIPKNDQYFNLFNLSRVKYFLCDLIVTIYSENLHKMKNEYQEFTNYLLEAFETFKKIKSENFSYLSAKLLIDNLDFTDRSERDKVETRVIHCDLKDNSISKLWGTLKIFFKEKLDELNQNIINIFYSYPLLQELKNFKIANSEFKTEVEYLRFIEEFNNKYPDHLNKPNILFNFFPGDEIYKYLNFSSKKKKISIREYILNENNLVSQFCKKGRIAVFFSEINQSEKNIRMCFEDDELGNSKVFSGKDFEKIVAKNKNWKYDIVIFCMPGGSAYSEIIKKNVNYAIFFDNLELFNSFQYSFNQSYNNVILKFVVYFIDEVIKRQKVEDAFNIAKHNFMHWIEQKFVYWFDINEKEKFSPILKKYTETLCTFEEGEIAFKDPIQTLKLVPLLNYKNVKETFFRKQEVFEFLIKILYSSKNVEFIFNLYGEKGVGKTQFVIFIANYLNSRVLFNKSKNNIHYVNAAKYFDCDITKQFDKLVKEEFAFQSINDKKYFNQKFKINFFLIFDECDNLLEKYREDFINCIKQLKFKLMNEKRLSPLIIMISREKIEIEDPALSFAYYQLNNFKEEKKSSTLLFSKVLQSLASNNLMITSKISINEFENNILKRMNELIIKNPSLYNPLNIINHVKTKYKTIYNQYISNTTRLSDLTINNLSQSFNVSHYEKHSQLNNFNDCKTTQHKKNHQFVYETQEAIKETDEENYPSDYKQYYSRSKKHSYKPDEGFKKLLTQEIEKKNIVTNLLNPKNEFQNEINTDMTKTLSFGKGKISCVDENSEYQHQQYESEKDVKSFNFL